MKVNEITISYSRTVSMRQFEPAVVFMSMKAQLDPGDKVPVVAAKLKEQVKTEVEEEVDRLKRRRRDDFDDEMEKAA